MKGKTVYKINRTGEVIGKFDSVRECALFHHVQKSYILKLLKSGVKFRNSFYFSYTLLNRLARKSKIKVEKNISTDMILFKYRDELINFLGSQTIKTLKRKDHDRIVNEIINLTKELC